MLAELATLQRNIFESKKKKDLNYYVFYVVDDRYGFVVFPHRSTASIINDKRELIDVIKKKTPQLMDYKTSMISFDALSANRNAWVSVTD